MLVLEIELCFRFLSNFALPDPRIAEKPPEKPLPPLLVVNLK
jgi:hypothetical protein